MACGRGIERAVRGLFWITALLMGVLWYIPADLAPPPPHATSSGLPSSCILTRCHGHTTLFLRYNLFLAILSCLNLTFGVKIRATVLAAGDRRKCVGAVPAPTLLRVMLLLAVASSAAGAALSAAALTALLEVRLGVVLACMSTPLQAAIYGATVLLAGAVCCSCAGLVMDGMSE